MAYGRREPNRKRCDLPLERVRRLKEQLDKTNAKIDNLVSKADALVDLAVEARAEFSGFMKLYAPQEEQLSRIEKRLERIEKRLDLIEA